AVPVHGGEALPQSLAHPRRAPPPHHPGARRRRRRPGSPPVGGVMTSATEYGVVVAGGGIAGVSVAAALASIGRSVLVVERGLDSARRLAGELIHPPGVSDLAELGLHAPLEAAGVTSVLGFAVLPEASGTPYLLPYGEIPGVAADGLAID